NQAPLLFLMALTSLRNQPLTQIFTLPFRPAMDTIGHENIHVLQERDPYETRTGYNMFRNAFKKSADRVIETSALHKNIRGANNLLSFGLAGYFRNDYEIQARLNTLLTHNYARWGVLPQTKHQLWAALIDAGLRAPAEIHAELKNSNEELSPFYKPDLTSTFNRAAKQITTVHVAELNTAYWGLISADLKKDYWHNTLPYIYGHLAELCGDQAGLARMGYTGPVHKECGALPADPAQRKIFWDRLTGKHSDTIKKHYAELETVEENGLSAIFADGTEIHLDDLDECIDFMREIARLKNLEAQRDLWIVDEPHIEAAARSIKQDTITRTLQSHSARTYPVAVDLKNRFAAPIPPVL
ncbi:MAG: hypothetical protein KKA05_05450, partial [Alphaproteobacteria bacterium]|nr:hypothetical protein [Alphaproteobacteria bacterium]